MERRQIADEAAAACKTTDECASGWARALGGLEIVSMVAPVPLPSKLRIVALAAKELGLGARAGKTYTVYRGVKKGKVVYVGITSRDVTVRAGEHASDMTKAGVRFRPIEGLTGLSKADARSVEQALIVGHGRIESRAGEALGGQLLNRINAISEKNPRYAELLERGVKILAKAGYRFG